MAEGDTWGQVIDSDQSICDEETAYMEEKWSEDESDYGHVLDREKPEPKPPDHTQDHSCNKKWCEEEDEWGEEDQEENDPIEESWSEDDEFQGGYDGEHVCEELNPKPPDRKWSPTYQTPHKPEHKVSTLVLNCESRDKIRFYEFSGSRGDYLQWEYNMDEYFKYYSIPSGERLTYCLDQLRGEAKRWWYQEENYRWYYKETPISTWVQLKWVMRKRYAPRSLAQLSKSSYFSKETSRGNISPNLVQNAIPKPANHQGKRYVPNTTLELTSCKYKNRRCIAKKLPRCEKLVNKRQAVQEKKPVIVMDQKKTTAMTNAELDVSISTRFDNLDKLCDKVMHLIMSKRVEKGLGTKEDSNQADFAKSQVNQKGAIVSASHPDQARATLSNPDYNDQKTDQRKETQPELIPLELKPHDQQLQDKSSNTLNLFELICYKCQESGHYAKECPTKRATNPTFLDLKINSVKEKDGTLESDLNIINSSMIHLSSPKFVETDSGVTSEEVEQKGSSAQASSMKLAQNNTYIVLSKETQQEVYIRPESGKCLETFILSETHEFAEDAGRLGSNLKSPEGKEARSGVITPVVEAAKDELNHKFNPEPNNKWKPKIEPEVERGKCIEEKRAVSCQYEQSVFGPRAPADLATKKTKIKAELLQNILRGAQVSEIQDLIQYWNNFLTGYSFKHYVFDIPMSIIMHLLLPLSVSKETGAMEKYNCLEEATSKPSTFSDQHQLEIQGKDPQAKFSNLSTIDGIICYRCHKGGHFARTCPTKKVKANSSIEPEQEKSKEKHVEMIFKNSSTSMMHLSLSRNAKTGTGVTMEASKRPERGRVIGSIQIKEKPPDSCSRSPNNKTRGNYLDSQRRMKPNLLYLGAGDIVSRSKHFQEGEYDEDIKSSSAKEHETRSHEKENMKLRKAKETSKLSLAQMEVKAYKWVVTICTLFPYPWFCPNGFSRKGFNEANWFTCFTPIQIPNGPDVDLRSLIESFRPNQDEPSNKSNCFGFSTHQRSMESWNQGQIHFGLGDIDFTSWVNRSFPDLDIGVLFGDFRPNQKEFSNKSTWYGILTQLGSSSNWIHAEIRYGLKVIQLLNRKILSLPYLEAHEFNEIETRLWRLQTYLWRPGVQGCHGSSPSKGVASLDSFLFILENFPFSVF